MSFCRRLATAFTAIAFFFVLAAIAQCDDGAFGKPIGYRFDDSSESDLAIEKLLDDAWRFDLVEDPLMATWVGENRYNDRLPAVSIADAKRRAKAKAGFLERLEAIDREKLSPANRVNYAIFARLTRDEITEAEFETYLMPITNRDGFHVSFAELGRRMPMETTKDYENYIARLAAFKRYAEQHIELMREAIKRGYTLPSVVLRRYREPIEAHIVDDPKKSLLYSVFTRFPESVSAADRERLEKAGKKAIVESVVPGYREFLKFMEDEYVPAARGTIGAADLPRGRQFYRHRVRQFTTLDDATPEQLHATGLAEVKRIRAEMESVIKSSGFKGDMAAFVKFLRTDPQFYATSPEQLMKETAFVLKKIDGQLPKLFKTLPRTPYGIRPVPDYIAPTTTTAYYSPPPGDGSDGGYYYVNTFNLRERPLYEIEALSLHEAVPGHHLQLALQQELDNVPPFRRFAGFTVFVEGWALYSERLGLETGFYQNPYSNYGRLTYEMWRACRLVVDAGMHYMGWSRQQAIDYMAENTALSMHNIRAEVDRYISWPGQALAYKTGELHIRHLRAEAEQKLGDRFDLREFHEVVLGSGSVPLSVLTGNVETYIANQALQTAAASTNAERQNPPMTRKSDHVDEYHGLKVADPYRWLEDPNSDETKKWVESQSKFTFDYLATLPQREPLKKRLTQLWDYEKFGVPGQRGGRYFITRNSGLQNQSVLYVADSLDAEPRELLDPNTLSEDGTIALSNIAVSDDGALMAYELSAAGSDWRTWKVRDVKAGKDLGDELKWVKFSDASWTPDGKGFYYCRYDEPSAEKELTEANYFQKLYYHRIGDDQAKDRLVYERPDQKEWGFDGSVIADGRFLAIHVWRGTERKNGLFYKDLAGDTEVVELLNDFDAAYSVIGCKGSRFFIKTDLDAERHRIIAIDLDKPEKKNWTTIVPESDDTLREANVVGGMIVASYLKDAQSTIRLFELDGTPAGEIELPGIGTAGGFGGRIEDRETFYSFGSYTSPTTIYRYDFDAHKSTVFRQPKVDFDSDRFVTKQVFYKSKDGTRVPMFITHKKGLQLNGANPTLLYAYGGFDIAITPQFSVTSAVWMEAGGVYAVANLRGGGEYGSGWHESGMLDKKQNVFDDFIAAAEWLIENKYTSSKRLAIQGASNGGLLVGATMTQRPDLFAVALPAVGVLDMLRFHKFTIGWAWTPEYGSSDDAAQFKTLYKYSPLHNVRSGVAYPATLIATADHDDRVVPAHSFKFAAALQAAQDSGAPPIYIRIQTRAGHGSGKPTSKLIEEAADNLAFSLEQMGVRELQLSAGKQ